MPRYSNALEKYGRQQALEMGKAKKAKRKAIRQKRKQKVNRPGKPEKPRPEREEWSDWWRWPEGVAPAYSMNSLAYFEMVAA